VSATVRLRVPAALRELTGGAAVLDVRVETADAVDAAGRATVRDVLDSLATANPALERRLRDELGTVRPHVNLFVGADNVRDLDGIDTVVTPGDDVSVVPAVSGG
jgi:molybdopterin converting factor small subunit